MERSAKITRSRAESNIDSLIHIDFEGHLIDSEFGELDEGSLAYAASIRKSQGSEYPAVVVPLTTQHHMLLERNLVCTGVPRGKQLVFLNTQFKTLAMAVRTQKSATQMTRVPVRVSSTPPKAGIPVPE